MILIALEFPVTEDRSRRQENQPRRELEQQQEAEDKKKPRKWPTDDHPVVHFDAQYRFNSQGSQPSHPD
jgi:hypothetical protein